MTLKLKFVYWTLFRPKYWADARPGVSSRASSSAGKTRRSIGSSSGGAGEQLRGIVPQALELIKRAGLGMKEVDDEVHEVQQHPPSARETLDVVGVVTAAVELVHHRLGDAADVGIRRARGDHEEIGRIGKPAQIEYHEIVALQVLNRAQRQA